MMGKVYEDNILLLTQYNDEEYTILKTVEELNELSVELVQKLTKPTKINKQEIIDEIGDVQIRLDMLKCIFGKDDVEKRMKKKIDKFIKNINSEKYKWI